MQLNKYKIGDLVAIVDERNSEGLRNFYGININKEFMPTVANTDNLDEKKYKVVRKNRFVYSGMQTGRDECIRIGLYSEEEPIIVSPAYTTFEIIDTNVVLPEYFFMLFLSKEKDRLGWFLSDSSIRSNLDWDRFCEIEFNLPDVKTQKKYVDIYLGLKHNIEAYQNGIDDLKLVCDSYIENLRRNMQCEKLGNYICEKDNRNTELEYSIDDVRGISIEKKFISTKANMENVSPKNYKIVDNSDFAFNPNTARMGDKLSIALNTEGSVLVSSIYPVFSVDKSKLLPEYLLLWFKRTEFDRYVRFNSWGSAREVYNYSDICEFELPIPTIETQQNIVNIYHSYFDRKTISEKLSNIQKTLCPILIKGSVEEAKNCEVASIG